MKQDYNNHRRYYAPHHFIFLPAMAFLTIWGMYKAWTQQEHSLPWSLFSLLSFSILYLALMLRQHYALMLQNRIVRLEFRLRYLEMFGDSARLTETQLSFAQIAALRFADDDQFKTLLQLTLKENLTADQIKRAIHNWQEDLMRV